MDTLAWARLRGHVWSAHNIVDKTHGQATAAPADCRLLASCLFWKQGRSPLVDMLGLVACRRVIRASVPSQVPITSPPVQASTWTCWGHNGKRTPRMDGAPHIVLILLPKTDRVGVQRAVVGGGGERGGVCSKPAMAFVF
jgi:hypothetical protein